MSWLIVSIRDSGIGIRPKQLDKLFQPFERLTQEKSNIEGTGLGMSVVKKIIDALGGSIRVESIPETGTTCTFEIPYMSTENQSQMMNDSDTTSTITVTNPKILLVEDNRNSIDLIKEIIQMFKYPIELIVSVKGETVMDLVKLHKPNLILLDQGLSETSGVDVLKDLKSEPEINSIPVIILSADANTFHMEKLLKAGASKYMTKPIDVEKLLCTLYKYLNLVNE
jgi:CheY-like chemotaxis protein